MQLLKGLSIAVIMLAFALGIVVGLNGRPDQADADAAKRQGYAVGFKKGVAAGEDEAYPLGLKDGMEKGTRLGRRKGKAAGEKDAGATNATGATGITAASGATGSTSSTSE